MSEDETEPKLYRWGDDDSDDGFLGEDPAASAPSLPVGSLAHLRATPQADQPIVRPLQCVRSLEMLSVTSRLAQN